MTFSTQDFARKPVAKLVQNLRKEEGHAQEHDIPRPEELLKLRQLRAEMIELNPDEKERREHEKEAPHEGYGMEHPPHVGKEPVEKAVRVDAFEADRQDVGALSQNLLSPSLFAPLEEFVPLVGNSRDDQVRLMELSNKALNFLKGNLLRREFRFKLLLNRLQRLFAV